MGYKQQAARIKQLTPVDAKGTERLLFAPPSYWLDLRGYYPPDVALRLKQPILILQGERDYNVTMDAFRDWQRSLDGRPSVTFKSYPKLDHLFLEGTGLQAMQIMLDRATLRSMSLMTSLCGSEKHQDI